MKYAITPHLARPMPRGFNLRTPLDALIDAEALHATPEATIEASQVEEALSTIFREGNIGEVGWAAEYRDAGNRSLSVGDVLRVRPEGRPEAEDSDWYVVMPMGFATVSWDDIYDLLTGESYRDAVEGKPA